MTSTDQPGPHGAPPPSNPYAVQPHAQPYAQQHPQQHPQQHGPQPWAARPRRTSPVVAVLLTVAGTLLAPLGYLLAAKGANDRYRLTAMMMQDGAELVAPTLLLLLGVLLLAAVALTAGWTPWAAVVPGVLLGLVGLHGVVDPIGAFRVPVDLFGFEAANWVGTFAAMGVPLLVSALLLGAAVAGALARRRGRREAG